MGSKWAKQWVLGLLLQHSAGFSMLVVCQPETLPGQKRMVVDDTVAGADNMSAAAVITAMAIAAGIERQ